MHGSASIIVATRHAVVVAENAGASIALTATLTAQTAAAEVSPCARIEPIAIAAIVFALLVGSTRLPERQFRIGHGALQSLILAIAELSSAAVTFAAADAAAARPSAGVLETRVTVLRRTRFAYRDSAHCVELTGNFGGALGVETA